MSDATGEGPYHLIPQEYLSHDRDGADTRHHAHVHIDLGLRGIRDQHSLGLLQRVDALLDFVPLPVRGRVLQVDPLVRKVVRDGIDRREHPREQARDRAEKAPHLTCPGRLRDTSEEAPL